MSFDTVVYCRHLKTFQMHIERTSIHTQCIVPFRYEDPETGLENEEFLPSADGKKQMRFTDVREKFTFMSIL